MKVKNFKNALDYYSSDFIRNTCKELKTFDLDALDFASNYMAQFVPNNSIFIPIPCRTGEPTYTLKLSNLIAKQSKSLSLPILKGKNRESMYQAKQQGRILTEEDIGFYLIDNIPNNENIFLVDNIIATGKTMEYAKKLIPQANVLVFAQEKSFCL